MQRLTANARDSFSPIRGARPPCSLFRSSVWYPTAGGYLLLALKISEPNDRITAVTFDSKSRMVSSRFRVAGGCETESQRRGKLCTEWGAMRVEAVPLPDQELV